MFISSMRAFLLASSISRANSLLSISPRSLFSDSSISFFLTSILFPSNSPSLLRSDSMSDSAFFTYSSISGCAFSTSPVSALDSSPPDRISLSSGIFDLNSISSMNSFASECHSGTNTSPLSVLSKEFLDIWMTFPDFTSSIS